MAQETVLSLIQKSTAFFTEKGVGEAKLSAEYLLAHVLKLKRLQMYLRFDQPVAEEELSEYRSLVRRRLSHEPLQYIVGSTEFYGMEYAVNSDVLIPRPETEHLIDVVLDLHKSELLRPDIRILDVGTGSGAIAVTLAAQLKNASVTATDISEAALEVARMNADAHDVSGRISFITHDIFDGQIVADPSPFDLIVSNPPYIAEAEIETLQPEVRDFEPRIAATDGADGLRFYRRIAERIDELLAPGGLVVVEIGYGQSEAVCRLFEDAGMKDISAQKDYAGIDRVVSAWR